VPPKDLLITVVLVSAVAAAAAVALPGCKQDPAPLVPELPQVERGPGRITGTVRFIGTPPPRKSQIVACDPRPDAARKEIVDNAVVVSDSGGFADVFVFVKSTADGRPLKGSGAAEPPLILDQIDCLFTPHALAIQVGQRLRIRNSDPTFHNVHWDPKLNRAVNFGFTPAPTSGERVVALTAAEFFSVRCDVHPWMNSHIGVFDHPFFATTAPDGTYEINGLPPGTYTISTWHPVYGDGTDQQVTVSATAEAVRSDFTYAPPNR
jgi:hypothetical protein